MTRSQTAEGGASEQAGAVVLASASTVRATLLRRAGVDVAVRPAGVDEDALKQAMQAERAPAREIATALAELKAQRVSQNHPDALVIGADQVLVCEDRLFDKPVARADARATLEALRGRAHDLVSAVAVARTGAVIWRHVATARLTARPYSDAFIEAYLDAVGDAALQSVGAYQLEGRGIQLFARIDGDYFTILGLPLLPLLDFLRGHGIVQA